MFESVWRGYPNKERCLAEKASNTNIMMFFAFASFLTLLGILIMDGSTDERETAELN
jgi:uncharacterized membrane protein